MVGVRYSKLVKNFESENVSLVFSDWIKHQLSYRDQLESIEILEVSSCLGLDRTSQMYRLTSNFVVGINKACFLIAWHLK